eukprot:TRINITY_DN16090_c0_g2_i1.p1 TRINITY_DN16090_c0_g2~~TRINITY_DN16090_c0_g2_i1.p1  ORF type:complete len:1650 (+),score=397.55 TRINITY_DN16090_c0_g2_i1:242-5191(+)
MPVCPPGGSPFKKVSSALSTATAGPEFVEKRSKGGALSEDCAGGDDEKGANEVNCDVQAFDIWYWDQTGTFVPETMYINAKDVAHCGNEPRLIVSLGSFQALSQAYVMSVERESIKSGLLRQKEDLLARCRISYYKELRHLREILEIARQQMAMQKNAMDDTTIKKMAEFERMVRETEVYYFDTCETLEPELKGLLKEAVKHFNRDLMRELFELRDRVALLDGGSADEGLIERLITLLMGRGYQPEQIVRTLAGMIRDEEQSTDFRTALRDILGISGIQRPKDDGGHYEMRGQRAAEPAVHHEPGPTRQPQAAAVQEVSAEPQPVGRGRLDPAPAVNDGKAEMALKAEIAKLEGELKMIKQMMEKQKQEAEAALAEERRLRKEADAKRKIAEDALERALKNAGGTSPTSEPKDVEEPRSRPPRARRQVEEDDDDEIDVPVVRRKKAATRRVVEEEEEPEIPKRRPRRNSGGGENKAVEDTLPSGGPHSDIDIEELLRRARELERQLKEAQEREQALLAKMKNMPKPETQHAPQTPPVASEPTRAAPPPARVQREAPPRRAETAPVRPMTPEDEDEAARVNRPKTHAVHKGLNLINRDYGEINRAGEYSVLSGKPLALIEEELKAERKRRLDLENETRKLTVQNEDLTTHKTQLQEALSGLETGYAEASAKLEKIYNQDELEGIDDVAVFCRYLIRRFGSLDRGFRALDENHSGLMSYVEFCRGLGGAGWIKIIGRRLFSIIDSDGRGQISLDMLHDVYRRYVDGRVEDPEASKRLAEAIEEQQKAEADTKLMTVAKERIKKLEAEKSELADENALLRKKVARSESQTVSVATKDQQAVNSMERKVNSIKVGYDNLKQERDTLASKMTAAMWKCREAYILQVKYKREADTKSDEFAKLTKKFEFFKSHYKSRGASAIDEDLGGTTHSMPVQSVHGHRGASPQPGNMMATCPVTIGGISLVSGAFNLSLASASPPTAHSVGTDAEDTDVCSLMPSMSLGLNDTSVSQEMSPARVLGENLDTARTLSPSPSVMTVAPGSSGTVTCPNCQALLRFDPTVQAAPGSIAGSPPPPPPPEAELSPEEIIGKITDEELLFGSPPGLAEGGVAAGNTTTVSGVGGGAAAGGHGSASSLPYRARIAARLEAGPKSRFELLFMDAQDRVKPSSQGGGLFQGALVSQQSHDLIEHARQIRLLWREAVPIDLVFPSSGQEERWQVPAATRPAYGRAATQPVTVGTVPMKKPLQIDFAAYEQMQLHQQQQIEQTRTLGSLQQQQQRSLHLQTLGSGLIESLGGAPSAGGDVHRAEERKRQILEEYAKMNRERERSRSPENSTKGVQPPLCIVGSGEINASGGVGVTTPLAPSASVSFGLPPTPSPERQEAARKPRPGVLDHLGSVSSIQAEEVSIDGPYEEDGTIRGTRARGNASVVGSWRSAHPIARAAREGVETPTPAGPQLGAGLPPTVSRSTTEIGRASGPMSPTKPRGPGARRTQHLPQLSRSGDSRSLRSTTSMPELTPQQQSGANRAPPLAMTSSSSNLASTGTPGGSIAKARIRRQQTSQGDVGQLPQAEAAATLRVGAAAGAQGPNEQRLPPQFRSCIGAARSTPSAKRTLLMATSAFELGSHVQRHAFESFLEPAVVIQGGAIPIPAAQAVLA